MKSRTIKPPTKPDGIPDLVKDMIDKPGIYIGHDPEQHSDYMVPLFSRGGKIFAMKISHELAPEGFIEGTVINGPLTPS